MKTIEGDCCATSSIIHNVSPEDHGPFEQSVVIDILRLHNVDIDRCIGARLSLKGEHADYTDPEQWHVVYSVCLSTEESLLRTYSPSDLGFAVMADVVWSDGETAQCVVVPA